ncbi:MAG: ribosome-binding factor A [Myxococcaceae bacterium]|jgi:ribosome-binding factor A|nr:ribosome-binding factor A [Myxococcaceae bacterium]
MTSSHRRPRGRNPVTSLHHLRHHQLLLEELRTLFRVEVTDARLTPLRIVAVELAADGASARVAWSGPDDVAVRLALERAAGFLQARLRESLGWKRTPRLRFVWLGLDASPLEEEPS